MTTGASAKLTRVLATSPLAERLGDEVVVTNLGQASMDMLRLADRPLNCYTYGAMGQCSSIALGIALARPDARVICLDGNGSLLMNLGSLCTIASVAPRNYVLLVWDNEVHQTTGGQPTATASRASLAAIARGGRRGEGLRGPHGGPSCARPTTAFSARTAHS
jgi:sulfopyruvate decarboxylase subunit beta